MEEKKDTESYVEEWIPKDNPHLEFDVLIPIKYDYTALFHKRYLFCWRRAVFFKLDKKDYSVLNDKFPPLQLVKIKTELYKDYLNEAIWEVFTKSYNIDKDFFVDFYCNPKKYYPDATINDDSRHQEYFLKDVIKYSDFKERITSLQKLELTLLKQPTFPTPLMKQYHSIKAKYPDAIKNNNKLSGMSKIIKANIRKTLKHKLPDVDEMLVDDLCDEINDGSFNDNFFFNPQRKNVGEYNNPIINELLKIHLSSSKTNDLSEYLNSLCNTYFPNTPQSWLLRWIKGVEGISVFDQFGQNFVELGSIYNNNFSDILTPDEKKIQDLTLKIWKSDLKTLPLGEIDNLINDIKNDRIQTYNDRRIRRIAEQLPEDANGGRLLRCYYKSRSKSDALIAAAICGGSSGGVDSRSLFYKRELVLQQWAKHSKCWIDDIEEYARQHSWKRAPELDGTESMIYTTPNGFVAKIWCMEKYHENLRLATEKIILNNFFFGEETFLNVIGFTKVDHRLRFVLLQPKIKHIKENVNYNGYTIRKYLREKFPNQDIGKHEYAYIVFLRGCTIFDLHGGNVVKSENGNFYVIDCNILYTKENPKPWYLRGLSSTPNAKTIRLGSLLSGFSATPDTFDIEYRTIPQITIDRYADILAQKEDWQNFYHWYFFIQKPLKFKDGTFKEGFIETSFDTYLKKNEIGSSQVRLFVKRVTNLFNFICDKCCIRYHTYRVRYEDHGIFKYSNSNRKGTGGTMKLCFDYSENAIFKKAVTMFLALLNANMDDDGNDGVVLYNYHAFKDAEFCTFEKSDEALNNTFSVGNYICYKGFEETIFKIVGFKGNRYIVIDLADRTKTKNEIPMSDNDKLQMASFPLLVKEMELLDNFNNLIKDLETELINSKLVYVVKYNKNEEIKPAIAKKIEELMLANINLEKYKLLYKRYAIDNKYRESIVNKVYEDIYDKLLQLANENTKPKPKFKIGDYVIYYLSPKNPLKIRSVRYDGRSYYYGFDKNISNFQNIYEKYLSKSLGNVVEELQPSGLSGFEDEFSKELLVAEMHLLELEKLKDFGVKIGGSAKDRYNGRKSKDKTENGQKTKGFNRLPTMDEMQSFGQECFHTKFKPNVSDFEDFGLNKIVARLCFFHYYGIFDKYAGYNVKSINDLYSLVDDKRIQDTITSYFIENKRHTQNFKTQYFAPDAKVHFYAIDFVYTALSMNLEKDLKDDFDYKNVLKAYNRGNKDWHFYRDKCIFLDKNKNDITEENKQRVFNLAYENAMNDFPLFRVMLTYNNGIIFIAHKDCKENQRTWRPLSQKYAKDLQQDICSAGWQDIYKHYAELYVKGKELYGQQFGFDEPDKWRFKDKEGLFAKVREGKDWRNGRNAEPKDFIDTFGFRAVEFGETMPQKERWEHLNRTFDSLMDLCDILNIKPENISLGGTLALSFGSRGRGGKHAAAAHYEPTKKVINLTRRSGAGCLAHEWFHAFDNQVCDHSYAYGQSCYGTRDAYSGWITNQDVSHYFYLFSNYCSNINGFNFYKSAVALDYYEKRKEDYWQKKLECGARAFEWYVIKKLTDRQQINEYLAQIPLAEPDRMKLYPYPHPNDYDTIENIFDGIFKNLQQVKTPTGVTIR